MFENYVVVGTINRGGQSGLYPVPFYFDFREDAEAYASNLPPSGNPEVRVATWEDIERNGLIFRSGSASRQKL
jgi:hypothetical protein